MIGASGWGPLMVGGGLDADAVAGKRHAIARPTVAKKKSER
jgi:hypothetical protein